VAVLENPGVQLSLIQYKDYICAEILADSLAFYPVLNEGVEIEVNDAILKVNVLKNSK
jgi:isoleucyl-tRNA synthetase